MEIIVERLNKTEYLNRQLELSNNTSSAKRLGSTAFSIATNGREGRLFMTWKMDTDTSIVKHVRSYCLVEEEHYSNHDRIVDNTLDWG